MTSLLFELFSEEIPARMQVRAAEQLRDLLGEVITSEGLAWQEARVFATARRLALTAHGLPLVQADRPIERKGPRVGAPQAAMDGFLRSLGDVDYRLEERAEKKGEAVYALYTAKGRSTAEILGEALPNLLAKFPWPKSMRWGDGDARWVRPLQAIVCLLDGEIVPFAFAGIDAGRTTFGHRFMAPDAIEISGADDYRPQLEAAYVMLDGAQRRELIAERASLIASQQGLVLRNDPGLLRELEGLAEWPVLLLGAIDPQFMDLPAEVLVISMRSHQKYLALETADGALAARFIIVANIEAKDGGAAIIAGNERVLRARLWDAKFFWDRDLKKPLEERLPALENMVFQAELGTLREKVERIERLAATIAGAIDEADPTSAARAARLAKCDLVSGMVGEFPELQGVMGSYYARHQGEPEAVAQAIAEHYSPQGPNDRCPDAPVSIAVALADKIDTLAGFFAAGIMPTGSSDPFALRRAALGVIRLILENNVRIDLRQILLVATAAYSSDADERVVNGLRDFIIERLKVQQRQSGVRHDIIAAVNANNDSDLVRVMARVSALQAMIETSEGNDLLAGFRRADNIVEESWRDTLDAVDETLFAEPAERDLASALEDYEPKIREAVGAEKFEDAVRYAAALRNPIDRFFDEVMVNVEDADIRRNRMRLLLRITGALEALADFAQIEDRK